MRYLVDGQTREVKMRDGTTYPASPSGHVVITDPKHLDEMDRGNKDYYANATTFGGDGPVCVCGYVGWPWTRVCPRCAQVLVV